MHLSLSMHTEQQKTAIYDDMCRISRFYLLIFYQYYFHASKELPHKMDAVAHDKIGTKLIQVQLVLYPTGLVDETRLDRPRSSAR